MFREVFQMMLDLSGANVEREWQRRKHIMEKASGRFSVQLKRGKHMEEIFVGN